MSVTISQIPGTGTASSSDEKSNKMANSTKNVNTSANTAQLDKANLTEARITPKNQNELQTEKEPKESSKS